MVMCFVPDCKHYSEKQNCKFFRFPTDPSVKQKWVSLIRRGDNQPTMNSLVCSCHFRTGDRTSLPTIFKRNEDKLFTFESPDSKKRKPQDKRRVSTSNSLLGEMEPQPSTSTARDVTETDCSSSRQECTSESRSSSTKFFSNLKGTAQQEAELYFLQKNVDEAQERLNKLTISFSFNHIQNDDKLINMYTGMPNKYMFECLYGLFENINLKYYLGWTVGTITKRDQLLLTLMKLRLNLLNLDLAFRFNCSVTTVSNIIYTWIHALHEILFCQLMKHIPSRTKNKSCMPSCFSTFTNCRIVLDCTEVKCMKPTSMEKQRLTYSNYKHTNTLKGLVGVAPNGVLTFISELYPGSTSDKKIVSDSGVLEKMTPGDLVLADKGFLIKDLLPPGVSLNIPPFLVTSQFTPQQAIQTRTIARARIHVERAIRRIKCFSILDSVPSSLIPLSTMIFQVCGALTNMQLPLIAEVEDLYENTKE
uniref:Uncharacterized protein LOC114346661 n=1 Tax=Diabrotica virgifera virgifera TaxID=50390 RepID=A0A6P7H661_DIAVI